MVLKQEKLLDQAIFMGHGSHKNSVCGQAGLVLFSLLCFVRRRECTEGRDPVACDKGMSSKRNAWRCRLH